MLHTAASEIDDLDGALRRVAEKNILAMYQSKHVPEAKRITNLRLQITVHHAMMPHQAQGQQHLARKTTNQRRGEASERVCLDQLVEIYAQKLHGDAQMIPEVEMFRHFDDMMSSFGILQTSSV